MIDGYTTVNASDLSVGDVVIVERKHFDYKTGRPVEPEYFRTIVGEHRTVAGMAKHLVSEPTVEWPAIPQWQGRSELTDMPPQRDGTIESSHNGM